MNTFTFLMGVGFQEVILLLFAIFLFIGVPVALIVLVIILLKRSRKNAIQGNKSNSNGTLVMVGILSVLLLQCKNLDKNQSTIASVDEEMEDNAVTPESISGSIGIVPTIRSVFGDSNTVHCANVEYLWNELAVHSDKPIANNALAVIFEKSKEWERSMANSQMILAFGDPQETYGSIVDQYKEKYNIDRSDIIPQGNTFWGYTDKLVNYKYAEPFDEHKLMFLGTMVSGFGFDSGFNSVFTKEHFADQFDVLYYNPNGEFVVRLIPANSSDEIILAMISKQDSFLAMFEKSQQLIKSGQREIQKNPLVYILAQEDELIIPVIRFNALRLYYEVQGLEFSSNFGPIDRFEQNISFNFDRKGVVLEANVEMYDSVGMPQQPKLLHFNQPFYLYIREANANHPYFNLWISDSEILERI